MAADRTATIEALYRALNQRNLDAALVHFGPGATWPNAETGGAVSGHDALRAYFTALWKKVDPIMEPVRIEPGPATQVASSAVYFSGDIARHAAAEEQREAVRRRSQQAVGQPFSQAAWDRTKSDTLRLLRRALPARAHCQQPERHRRHRLRRAPTG